MFIYVGGHRYDMNNQEQANYVFSTLFNPNSQYFDQRYLDALLIGQFGNTIKTNYLEWKNANDILSNASQSGDYVGAQGQLSNIGYELTPDTEKWLDNMIGQQNAQADRNYQTEMRDSSLLSSANQLSQLGLSPSNVIQVGGSASGVSSSPASQSFHSVASLKQQRRMNDFNQKMGLAKSMISAASSMASSGIYGSAIASVKNAGARLASATAHSGLKALKSMSVGSYKDYGTPIKPGSKDDKEWDAMMAEMANY